MKFNIRDEDGNEYEVKEVMNESDTSTETLPQNEVTTDDELSSDEVMALKKLASVAEKLIALIPSEESSSEMSDEDEDEDEEITSNEGEEVIVNTDDCDNMGMKKDSLKKAVGANERKRRAEDSIVEDAVSNAWAKRYGGKR